ncbi:MAG: antitoxin Xre/MbcA/ParS toxin-binding domain-containing protein [Pseudomonadota bacterium]
MLPGNAQIQRDDELLAKAAMRAISRLRLSQTDLSEIIGVSKSVVSGMANGRGLPSSPKARELVVLFLRVYRSLDAIVGGDDEVAAQWFKNANTALAGTPVQLVKTVAGLTTVLTYLDARRALV